MMQMDMEEVTEKQGIRLRTWSRSKEDVMIRDSWDAWIPDMEQSFNSDRDED